MNSFQLSPLITVLRQTHGKHSPSWKIGDRKLLVTVRDPIGHFLSGWAECGARSKTDFFAKNTSIPFDMKIQKWLSYIQTCTGRTLCSCRVHSMPQANFLFVSDTIYEIDPKVDIIGNMRELPELLEFVGYPYDPSISAGNNGTENEIKKTHFQVDKSLLSNNTIQALCKYLRLDYYLFDFEPPAACRDQIALEIANMTASFD